MQFLHSERHTRTETNISKQLIQSGKDNYMEMKCKSFQILNTEKPANLLVLTTGSIAGVKGGKV